MLVGVLLIGYALAFAGSSAGHGWYLAGHLLKAHDAPIVLDDVQVAADDHAHDEDDHHHHGRQRRPHFTLPPSVDAARVATVYRAEDAPHDQEANAPHAHSGRTHVHAMPDDGDQASRILVLLDRHQLPPTSDLPVRRAMNGTLVAGVSPMLRGPQEGIETPPPQSEG